jgi:ribosomal RNA-processing protein 1
MWMSDKPLVQEELAEDLGSLVHCFPDLKVGIQFFRNFLETMCLEWFGIDQWRIDKFMMVSKQKSGLQYSSIFNRFISYF